MVADAGCVVVEMVPWFVFPGCAAAKSVVRSMRQINDPMSFVFIFFTSILFSNVAWFYKHIPYNFKGCFHGFIVILSQNEVFVSQGTRPCLLFGPLWRTLMRTRRSPG